MKPSWTGKLIGNMHIYEVTQVELAKELGCTRGYVNMVLNGKFSPAGVKERFTQALNAILERRKG